MSDPFTLAEQYVVDALQASDAVTNIMSAVNIIQFDVDNLPTDDVSSEVDLPAALIQPASMSQSLSYASNAVHIQTTYSLDLNTGRYDLHTYMNPLRFALISAFTDMLYSATMQTITWNSKKFIVDVDLLPGEIGISDVSVNRGIAGFSAVFQFVIEMVFTRDDLVAFNQGTL